MVVAAEESPHRILVVDDNPSIALLLKQVLVAEGYAVTIARDGLEALARVEQVAPDLILLDLELPFLNGDEICKRLKASPATRLIPILIVTAQSDTHHKLNLLDNGADDFLTKPFHLPEVTTRCRSLLRIKRLIEERDSAEAVVFALARTVEAKSGYTRGHSERVMTYALALADALGLPAEDQEVLRKGALLHDIGKIHVPDAILDKPGPLTKDEFDIIKQHTVIGAHIVEPLHSVRHAVPLIRSHHERLDGRGYPDGLKGDQIPLLVRLISVVDVYDSLASDRPYRPRMPHEMCLKIMRETAAGGGLDGKLVALFEDVVQLNRPEFPLGTRLHSSSLSSAGKLNLVIDPV